jgi:hypothetical protein
MTMELVRLATVGALMFGGGVAATNFAAGLPLTGTQCAGTHCGPAAYRPALVTNEKDVFPPICPSIAGFAGVGDVPAVRAGTATFASFQTPLRLSDAAPGGKPDVDTFLAESNRNKVVLTAPAGGRSTVVFVLYGCSTSGLAEQFVRVPVDPNGQITLETIRVPRPRQP